MKTILSTFVFCFVSYFSASQTANSETSKATINGIPITELKELCRNDTPRLEAIFKDLHSNPELPFMEVRTSGIIAKELKALGFQITEKVGKTGVVGVLKNGNGPTIMYRADMDCIAVEEATNLPYKSIKKGKNEEGKDLPVMHACGHDAHVTWMLGIAKQMVKLKDKWKGTLVLVGQPAEENGFGAIAMANEMYTKGVPVPDLLLGMHTGPAPVGVYLNRPGERMAGAVQLDVTFFGVGGHGSTPEQTKDPIVMAANAILQYQTIVSRNSHPQFPVVLTVGAVEAGIDNNVIPNKALLKLNLRWYRQQDKELLLKRISEINEGIAVANNLPKDLYPKTVIKQNLGTLKNNEALTAKINGALEKMAGPNKNLSIPPVMGSEDVQELLKDHPEVPYNYFIVGIANHEVFEKALKEGKQFPFSNHNPDFWVDLSAIPFGTTLGLAAVLEAFAQ
ncbi:hippurate hydrolase [Flavobacterium succinicans]|uniref:Hippurate hydrolase n=1 Tax=Flavobacterium succinicans TaxID=29536 RepID=A0A1I4TB37_9FLAO|nr:amidohydrolase [Flavobacterium succinicans]SFM73939.1 hippurate hydrolase [Flavobacterium succinicans]